jgi:hypothetical protein
MSAAEVVRLHVQLLGVTERLVREHRERLAAGAVIRAVAAARDELRGKAEGVDLVDAVETGARQRLRERLSQV